MKQLLVRGLGDEVVKKLKKRAESNHRSLQRELHFILSQAATAVSEAGEKRVARGVRMARKKSTPTGSVWNWLKRPSAGNLSKEDIDSYIRVERESWGSP